MFRTRDFALLFSIIAFLVVSIGGTLLMRWLQGKSVLGETGEVVNELVFIDSNNATFTAEVSEDAQLDRAERLAAMRNKIAEYDAFSAEDNIIIKNPIDIDIEADVQASTTKELQNASTTPVEKVAEQRCVPYQVYSGLWQPVGLQIDVVEGVRLVYRDLETVVGTSTQLVREVAATLPVYSQYSGGSQSCIPSDVIGIAKDGSLIRNNEIALYSVFDFNTVIGYALDGFPIYGVGSWSTDVCGGVSVGGEYAYYLNAELETIINCFSAQPITLP